VSSALLFLELRLQSSRGLFHSRSQIGFVLSEAFGDLWRAERHNLGRQNPGIGRTTCPNSHGGDRNPTRHLHGGQQRIKPLQRRRIDRDPNHGQRRFRSDDSGKMCCAASPSNDDSYPSLGRSARQRSCPLWGTVRRADRNFIGNL
jgi:hypothetical protein